MPNYQSPGSEEHMFNRGSYHGNATDKYTLDHKTKGDAKTRLFTLHQLWKEPHHMSSYWVQLFQQQVYVGVPVLNDTYIVKAKVDTGAQANVLPYHIYALLRPPPITNHSSIIQ